MASALYPSAKAAFLSADIDLLVDTIKVTAVTSGYTYSSAHNMIDDVPGGDRVFTETLAGISVTGGVVDATDVTSVAVAAGDTITALILWKSTGVEATSALICYLDTLADTNPISITTNDGDIRLAWSNGANRIFAL